PITVAINGDLTFEADETLFVNLSNASTGNTITRAQAAFTDRNDDSAPTLSVTNVGVTEGNSGTTNAVLTVNLSVPSALTATVTYATHDGSVNNGGTSGVGSKNAVTAAITGGLEYLAASGTLTFAPSMTTLPITVVVNGDTNV